MLGYNNDKCSYDKEGCVNMAPLLPDKEVDVIVAPLIICKGVLE